MVLGMERLHRTIDYNAELDGGPGAVRTVTSNGINTYGSASNSGGGGGGAAASSVAVGLGGSGGGGVATAAPGGGGSAQGAGSQVLRHYCKECAAVIADMYPGVLLQQQQHPPLPVRRTNSGRVVATIGSADGSGAQVEFGQHTTHTYLATGPGAALVATGASGGGGGLGLGLGSPPAAALSMETTLGGLLSEPSSRQPLLSHHGSIGMGGALAGAGAPAGAPNGGQQQGAVVAVPQSPRLLGAAPSPRMGGDRQARCQVGGLGSGASAGYSSRSISGWWTDCWGEEGPPFPECPAPCRQQQQQQQWRTKCTNQISISSCLRVGEVVPKCRRVSWVRSQTKRGVLTTRTHLGMAIGATPAQHALLRLHGEMSCRRAGGTCTARPSTWSRWRWFRSRGCWR